MHPAFQMTIALVIPRFFEDGDATDGSAESCYSMLKCRKKELTSGKTQNNA